MEVSDRDTVVGDRDSGPTDTFQTGEHLLAVQHAGPAMDDELKEIEVFGQRSSANPGVGKRAANFLFKPAGNFYRADIIVCAMMGTGFRDQNLIARLQILNGVGSTHELRQMAFIPGKKDRERGKGDVRRSQLINSLKDLGVGDNQTGGGFEHA